jgi:pimeloyl-ACP methyl ester carboxylesterase
VLREGSGEPLVLYHGILCSERVWRNVVPLLTGDFEVIVPNALGHRDGSARPTTPVTIVDVIDDAERQLDEMGVEKAHMAGNSMGGWVALELARRGRAKSVCGLAPAGFWDESWEDEHQRVANLLLEAVRDVNRGRRIAPLLSRSIRFRRWALSNACLYGDRVTRAEFLDAGEDTMACTIAEDITQPGFSLPAHDASCPVTLAWAAEDRLFPLSVYEERARGHVGGAEFLVLDDVGHVPMYDDPRLTAETIRATVARAAAPA